MAPIDLERVRAFTAVHETVSFTAAAVRLGVPRSTVSRAIAALEDEVGVRLFHRTTRSVASTSAGDALYDRVVAPLGQLDAALADLPEREIEPSGTLRVTSTVDLGATVLAEASARFTTRYPRTRVDVLLTNTIVDLVRAGVDLALRIRVRRARDSSLVVRKVGAIAIELYASPSYVARVGAPRGLDELARRDWIGYRGAGGVLRDAEHRLSVEVTPRILCDDMGFARDVLRAGAGIGTLPTYLAAADVAAGTLVRVLPRWSDVIGDVVLAYPARKNLPPKVTAYAAIVEELLRRRPLT